MISSGRCVMKPPDTIYCFDIFPDREGKIDKLRLCIRTVGRVLNPLPPEYRIGYCTMDVISLIFITDFTRTKYVHQTLAKLTCDIIK